MFKENIITGTVIEKERRMPVLPEYGMISFYWETA